ncbi:MAG: methionyl-tRNA formyltransferase [Spirochaetaceae bacterium]|jgi:methionyl-tRNA formyltransferase|nr:methionyl-tRNA formyltransferase [Spirochaetaceae bacterium]
MNKKIRILFAGTPGIGLPSLLALLNTPEAEVAGILTAPDAPKKRKNTPEPSEISSAGAQAEPRLRQFKPQTLDAQARAAISEIQPDLLVAFAYGRIFGPKFLELFPLGGINVHPSLLPKYRGPSPISAAILHRDSETGVTIQRIALELDAGDILAQERFPLKDRETAASLTETAARKAGTMLPRVIAEIARQGVSGRPQEGRVSYCPRIAKTDGRIDWTQSAEALDAHIRAYTPWPLAYTLHGDRYLYILAAEGVPGKDQAEPGAVLGIQGDRGILVQTGAGILGLTRLQYQAKKALPWQEFLNGARDILKAHLR